MRMHMAREASAPDLRLGSRQGMGGEISRAVTAQHLGQVHPGGGANHAGALSAWAGRAVPAERWCRSDGYAPDAHSANVLQHICAIRYRKLLCVVPSLGL